MFLFFISCVKKCNWNISVKEKKKKKKIISFEYEERAVLFMISKYMNKNVIYCMLRRAASWRKRLDARLPALGSRVRVSVTPCGFRGGRNEIWVGFSRGFSRFHLPQISFHHFSTLISSSSFPFIRPCDGASGVVGRHPCYSRTYNKGASSHLIPRPDLVLDTSWGYLFTWEKIKIFIF